MYVLVDPGQLARESTVLMFQLIPYVLVLRHLLISFVVDSSDDVIVDFIDSLHELAHFLL